jgi:hypothetical protein
MVNILQFLACLQNPRLQGEGLGAPDPPAQHLQGLQAQGGAHAGGSVGLSRQVGHVVIKAQGTQTGLSVLKAHGWENSTQTRISFWQCCGSALVSMRIRIQLFMSLQIRIRIRLQEAKSMRIRIRILIRLLSHKKLNFYMTNICTCTALYRTQLPVHRKLIQWLLGPSPSLSATRDRPTVTGPDSKGVRTRSNLFS